MAEIKKISTELQLLDKFLDTSGDAGTSGQVLTSTGTGINWVSGGGLPGGPYLPLVGGRMTGTAKIEFNNASQYIQAISNNDLDIVAGDDINYRSNFSRFFSGSVEHARLSGLTNQNNWIALTSSTKLGVGTISPARKLHIQDTTGNPQLVIGDGASAYSSIQSSNGLYINAGEGGGGSETIFRRGTSFTESMRINSSGTVLINASAPRQTYSTTVPTKLSVQGGMSEFETTLTNNNDWENSPVSILERANIGAGSTDNKYAPNLNFHWSTKVSNSLWMGANGHLTYGSYTSAGVPAADGTFKAGNLIAALNITGNTGSFTGQVTGPTPTTTTSFANKAYVDAHGGGTGPFLPLVGGTMTGTSSVLMPDNFKLKLGTGGDAIFQHNGSHLFIDNSFGSTYLRNTSTGSILLRNSTGGDIQFDNEFAGNILFNTSNIERMRIDSVGNVGIGNTSPAKKLEISSGTDGDGILLTGTGSFATGSSRNIEFSYSDTDTSYASAIKFEVKDNAVHGGQIGFFTDAGPSSTASIGVLTRAMTIDPNQNVGIGTASPGKKLHVKTTTSNSTPQVLVQNNGTGDASILLNVSGQSYVFGIDYDDSKKFKIASSGNLGTTDRVTLLSTGNVGIGTITPDQKLQVQGNIRIPAQGKIVFGSAGATPSDYLELYDINASGSLLKLVQDNNTRFVVQGVTGNVGIGVTGPTAKLHVSGNTKLTGGTFGVSTDASVGGTGGFSYSFRDAVGINNPNSLSAPSVSGYVMSVGRSTSSGVGGGIYVEGESRFVRGLAGDIKFVAYGGTSQTGSPTHILGTDANGLVVKSTAGSSIGPWLPLAAGSGERVTGDLYISEAIFMRPSATYGGGYRVMTATGTNSAPFTSTISFSNYAQSNVMVIQGSNVGIGTTGPSKKLHVVGDQLIFGDLLLEGSANSFRTVSMNTVDGSDNQTLSLCGGATSSLARGGRVDIKGNEVSSDGGSVAIIAGNVSTGDIDFFTASSQRMIINNTGNVGIGTTSPTQKLHINGGAMFITDGTYGGFLGKGNGLITTASASDLGVRSESNMVFSTGGNVEKMRITSAGNVGIGTTNPSSKLTVADGMDGSNSQTGLEFIPQDSSNRNIIFSYDRSSSAYRQLNLDASDFKFNPGGSTKMVILNNGNVGIGITNPNVPLDVEGKIRSNDNSSGDYLEIFCDGSVSGDSYIENTNNNIQIKSAFATSFSTSGSVAMFIKNNQNVGIGTVTPGAKLDVAGIIFAGDGNKATPGYSFASDPDTGMFRDSANVLTFGVGADRRMSISNTVITTALPLGVNTTAVTSGIKLQVQGNVLFGSSGVGDLYLGNYATANHFRFHTNNANTYFDMNCGDIYWRQGTSTRYTFFPSTANMTVQGTITQNSDARTKENVVEISDCISKVKSMRGVYYNRTDFNTDVTKVGVIAQEVEAVLPELVLESPETGLKSVAYSELTSVLINAIKEQQEIIEDLKTRITKLEN